VTVAFNAARLTLGRQRRGKTQTRLAADCEIDARNIRRYEAGDASPSKETLNALAAALDFPVEFFLQDDPVVLLAQEASFRSLSTMTQQQADAALGAGSIAIDLANFLEKHLNLQKPALPDLSGATPEQAARELRSAWGLGNQPLPSAIQQLEAKGVRVFSLVEECKTVDAFCVQHKGVPFIFLNTMKSAEHSRFDACHELAHLTLHQSGPRRGKQIELEAHSFASSFLMPKEDVLAHAPRDVTVDAIVRGKRRWGVSAVAYARRLYTLSLVREWHYKQLCIEMSRLGFRTREPQPMLHEVSGLYQPAFELLKKKGIGRDDVAKALHISVAELDRLVFGLTLVPVRGEGQSTSRSRAQLRVVPGAKRI
jgi:Zn-dependent peptidase ImmA (M78 family)/DNA-binding XRE family transcriptional regulator